ncbi:hypothetical protein Syun_030726 [Stephania yunnanensis]|uniref:Uncharacterized protein n=1 Tax=Stephania yunnanensis TaxID=152371 RepID=A0AAP0DVJ9_9MAGN
MDEKEFHGEEQISKSHNDQEDSLNPEGADADREQIRQHHQQERELMLWSITETDDDHDSDGSTVDDDEGPHYGGYNDYIIEAELDTLLEEDVDSDNHTDQDMEEDDIDPDEMTYEACPICNVDVSSSQSLPTPFSKSA